MSIDAVTSYIEKASTDLASAWNYDDVVSLGEKAPPAAFMGDQELLLKGDQHRLWLRWFLEGLVSPHRVAADLSLDRLDVYAAALKRVDAIYGNLDKERRTRLADAITNHVFATVTQLRSAAKRDYATSATRLALIVANSPPRCYICGYAFTREALDAFLRVKGRSAIKVPALVDVFQPRGLVLRDEGIEIEHVVPVAAGGTGQANLRLACGWCNKHKSDRVSIYEAPPLASRTLTYRIGPHQLNELPNPFWTIRTMALRGRCQHRDGCGKTAKDAELLVSLADWTGSPNPTNLVVYCEQHDPLKVDRRQARADVQRLWDSRS